MPETECKVSYTKTELIAELEGYGDIVVYPDDYTWNQLEAKLRYYRCCNCISYEDRKGCNHCTKEILYEYDNFYEE